MRVHALPHIARTDGAFPASAPWASTIPLLSATLGDLVVGLGVSCCAAAAPLLALADVILRPFRTWRLTHALIDAGLNPVRELRRIWFVRAAREALRILARAGLSAAVVRRVVVRGNTDALETPAVLAVYHTPWARVLASWICTHRRTVLFAGPLWVTRAPGAHVPSDMRGMRRVIPELRGGGSAAVTVDHFGERGRIRCRAQILGAPVEACAGAARLAARAGVPIVPVGLRWHNGRLEVWLGHRFDVSTRSVGAGMSAVLWEFNATLRRDLSSWADAHRFLSSRGASLRTSQSST